MLFCYMIETVGVLDQASQEYYISATQSHDKPKAIQYKNHPLQTLYFTGFSKSQNSTICYRQDVRKNKALWGIKRMTSSHFVSIF